MVRPLIIIIVIDLLLIVIDIIIIKDRIIIIISIKGLRESGGIRVYVGGVPCQLD